MREILDWQDQSSASDTCSLEQVCRESVLRSHRPCIDFHFKATVGGAWFLSYPMSFKLTQFYLLILK